MSKIIREVGNDYFLNVYFEDGFEIAIEYNKEHNDYGFSAFEKDGHPLDGLYCPPNELYDDVNEVYLRLIFLAQQHTMEK